MKPVKTMTHDELNEYLARMAKAKGGGARGSSDGGQCMYKNCLDDARAKGTVGIHKHMKCPTDPTSRLGFVGKPASKKTLKELAEAGKIPAGRTTTAKRSSSGDRNAEILAKLAELEAQAAAAAAPDSLQAKYEAMQKAKMSALTNVPQYGNVLDRSKLKNSVG